MQLNPLQVYAVRKAVAEVEESQARVRSFMSELGLDPDHSFDIDWNTGVVTDKTQALLDAVPVVADVEPAEEAGETGETAPAEEFDDEG